jgi:hypothetical protein
MLGVIIVIILSEVHGRYNKAKTLDAIDIFTHLYPWYILRLEASSGRKTEPHLPLAKRATFL